MIDQVANPAGQPKEGPIGSRLEAAGRMNYKMLTEGQPITEEQRAALVAEFEDWRSTQPIDGRPLPLKTAANRLGIREGTLSEVLSGKYKGDSDAILRLIDTHLAEERQRLGIRDVTSFARIRMTAEIFGAIQMAVNLGNQAAIIGPPGSAKSVHAAAYAAQRPHTYVVRIENEPADRLKVSELLCEALHDHRGRRELLKHRDKPHGQRMWAIKQFLAGHRNAVLLIDEAQKLSANGLETLRDLHDCSDPSGQRSLPIVFFGDERFLQLIGETREGRRRTKMTGQFVSRIYPILDLVSQMSDTGGLYTVEDILAITRNQRLRILTTGAARWLCKLANVSGEYGHLRLAIKVLRGALMLYSDVIDKHGALDVVHLQEAFKLATGKCLAQEINSASGGELLRKVG